MIAEVEFYQLVLTTAINISLLIYRDYVDGSYFNSIQRYAFFFINIYFFLVFLY